MRTREMMRRLVSDGMRYAPKVSATAAKQTNNLSAQKLTVRLELGDRWSWYCVVDETGCLVHSRTEKTNWMRTA